jgi:hypothetical protein
VLAAIETEDIQIQPRTETVGRAAGHRRLERRFGLGGPAAEAQHLA